MTDVTLPGLCFLFLVYIYIYIYLYIYKYTCLIYLEWAGTLNNFLGSVFCHFSFLTCSFAISACVNKAFDAWSVPISASYLISSLKLLRIV